VTESIVWGSVDGREISFPMEVPDFNGLTVLYTVPRPAAQALVPGEAFDVLEVAPGLAQLIVAAVDYRDNPWGDYNELNLGFLVRPVGAAEEVMGSFVFRMPVDQAFTSKAGNEVMGFPKTVEHIEVTYTDDSFAFSLESGGAFAIRLQAPLVAPAGDPARVTSVSYSYIDGVPHGTELDIELGTGLIDPAEVVLELGTGVFADELRSLGLPKRADLAMWGEHLSATFSLGAPVQM